MVSAHCPEKKYYEILWDCHVNTNHSMQVRRLDPIVRNKEKRTWRDPTSTHPCFILSNFFSNLLWILNQTLYPKHVCTFFSFCFPCKGNISCLLIFCSLFIFLLHVSFSHQSRVETFPCNSIQGMNSQIPGNQICFNKCYVT